ncbi:MAG: hypothetical protein AMXMBFR56_62170 [Polyangiaceae bacterium]
MTRRLTIDVADRPHKLVLECYCCARRAEVEEGVVAGVRFSRPPLNWTKDKYGNDRCPRHGVEGRFVTLGDLINAKRRGA